jgi:flagellar basal-body rod modification protein FlgD
MTTVTSVSPSPAQTSQLTSVKSLGQADFLKLMTAQLKQQDPFNPLDNTQMVAQMAQFSSVAGIGEMNSSLKSIADQLSAQTELLAEIRTATAQPQSGTPVTQ